MGICVVRKLPATEVRRISADKNRIDGMVLISAVPSLVASALLAAASRPNVLMLTSRHSAVFTAGHVSFQDVRGSFMDFQLAGC